jgi:hypothetical protein
MAQQPAYVFVDYSSTHDFYYVKLTVNGTSLCKRGNKEDLTSDAFEPITKIMVPVDVHRGSSDYVSEMPDGVSTPDMATVHVVYIYRCIRAHRPSAPSLIPRNLFM